MDQSLSQKTTKETNVKVFEPRHLLAAVLLWARARRAGLLAGALLGAMSLQMLAVISHKSITTDEIVHIPAGYYHLVVGDFQYLNPHPPTAMMLGALPLLFIQPNELPEDIRRKARLDGSFDLLAADHFWAANNSFFQSISFWTRVPAIALTVLLGVVIFYIARKLFGDVAAVISIGLYTLEPTVLAHGRILHTDVPSALGLLLFCFALYVYTSAPSLHHALWLGVATGLAPLTKFSMVALAPLVVLGALALVVFPSRLRLNRRAALGHVAAVVLVSLFIINLAYFFHNRPLTAADESWIAMSFPTRAGLVLGSVRVLRHIVPTDFLMGIYWQISHGAEGHPASIFGQHSRLGWWYYFPVAFALKTTTPFLITSVAAIFWALRRVVKQRDRAALFLLAPFLLFTAFVMTSTINIGVRYYLPAYPFLFMMSGALLARLTQVRDRRTIGVAVVGIVLGWSAIEAVRVHPNYIPYMNQLAYARPHWWYLSDSNVEWGDDVAELASYLHERGEPKVRAALLGGYATLGRYGVEYVDVFAPASIQLPETNYLVLGASYLNGSTVVPGPPGSGRETDEVRINFFDEYRQRTPEAVFGNSIYLYRVR
ncbi:MAG: glycosyltransferase family 39 protein [Acidobacteriota bacterium]|nr:glycosyltransferase family 39 protein [Acidobacteriota bacterium]